MFVWILWVGVVVRRGCVLSSSLDHGSNDVPAFDQDGPSTFYMYPYSRHGGEDKHRKSSKECCRYLWNFGCILFDNSESVKNVLSSQPIYLNDHHIKVDSLIPKKTILVY
ncbi:hypothetical protein TNCV_2189821 [Trichonephila clavipes]|nr:hypothetical protein TNCV_2189821 [Trichonephila clavipes]